MKTLLLLSNLFITIALSAQTFEWAKHQGGAADDIGMQMATDAAGNSYVTNIFTTSITIGAQTFSASNGNVVLSKYNSSGTVQWTIQLKSITIDEVFANSQHVYIAGQYKNAANIGVSSLTGDANGDAFFSKLDGTNGNVLLTKTGGGNGDDHFSGLALDQAQNIYVTGYFDTSATFNGTVFNGIGERNFFVIKYSTAGAIVWSDVAIKNGDFAITSQKLVVNPSGTNIYVLGHVSSEGPDSVKFKNIHFAPKEPGSNFIIHYDGTGNPQHIKETSSGPKVVEKDIALDNSGSIYLLTDYNDFPFQIAKYDAQLNAGWQLTDGGEQVTARDIEIAASGEIYVGGGFFGQGEFKADTLVAGSAANGFLAKYNTTGAHFWVKSITGSSNNVMEIGLDANNIYSVGFFTGTVDFDAISLSSNGGEDMFIAKLNPSVVSDITKFQNSTFQLYPNPTSGSAHLLLQGSDQKCIKIRNSIGQLIFSDVTIENELILSLGNFAGGIYFIEVSMGNILINKKMVIEK